MTVSGFTFLGLVTKSFGSNSGAVGAVGAAPTTAVASMTTEVATSAMSSGSHCQSSKCIAYAAGLVAGGALIGYLVGTALAQRRARCNYKVKLDCQKIADSVDIEDIGEKKSFCRCWKSEKFPYCDGAHNKHNRETGDNVGPVTIKGAKPAEAQSQ